MTTETKPKPKTKDELIAILLTRGHHRPALSRMKRDDLVALAEHAESTEHMAAEEAAGGPVPPIAAAPVAPALSGDIVIAVEEVAEGDVWPGGVKVKAVQSGPKWTWLQAKNGDWFAQIRTGAKVFVTR